jgi:hypothetical protein
MELEFKLDSAGFPTVYVAEIGVYVHWLPVTKIQMEYFLCNTSEISYNDSWYQHVRSFNPRVAPGNINTSNYWNAFITGVMPRDTLNYARWCREGYTLPTANQWFTMYESLLNIPASPNHLEQLFEQVTLKPRVKLLIQNIEASAQQAEFQLDGHRTLADQLLLRLGVMEFVYRDDNRNTYGGYGQTHSSFFPQMEIPRRGSPQALSNAREGAQLKQYGFRLINTSGRR